MAIEFEGVSSVPQSQTEATKLHQQQTEQTRERETAERAGARDTVSLTDTATRLRELEESVRSAPEVDVERVNAIREAIETGSFQVDASRVADKLLGIEQALNGAGDTGPSNQG
jgi:negative regulator of flagellin synthesis FlgM